MKTNKIAFVIDGYFGLALYKYIKSNFGKTVNYEGLVTVSCKALENVIQEKCISPANLRHYYMGTDLDRIDTDRNEYEDSLKLSRFGARGRPLQNGREKGIDTMLFSDIKDEAMAGSFDYLILLAGDLDHITLVQDLKSLGIKTVLLYGEIINNGVKTTGYSKELKAACFNSVNLLDLLENEEIFQNTQSNFSSMTDLMKGTHSNFTQGSIANIRRTRTQSVYGHNALLQKVIYSVEEVISDKESLQGRKLAFAFQAQVGTKLKEKGVTLPVALGEYLNSYPSVFRTGVHPVTQALTVSIKQ